MTSQPTSTPRDRRTLFVAAGVVILAVVATVLALSVLNREPETAGTPSVPPSSSPEPSQAPSGTPDPTDSPVPTERPTPTPVAASQEWTLVHSFGGDGPGWVGGEIAFGDAGFLAIGHRWEGGEGGVRIAEHAMWLSADGREWTEVQYPIAETGDYFPMALSGSADGSYVFHALAGGQDGTPATAVSLRSADGMTWEPIDTGLPERIDIQVIAEGVAGYLLVGGQTGDGNASLWLSSDALTWEQVHEFTQEDEFVQVQAADGGEDGYVVIGRRIAPDGGPYRRFTFASGDGREWVERPEPFGPDDQAFVGDVGISSHGPDWVATFSGRDDTTSTWTSSDGLTWTEAGRIPIRNVNVADAGLLAEVADELVSSPGGGSWIEGTPGVYSSTDGAAWAAVDPLAEAWLSQLAIGDGVAAVIGTISGDDATTGAIWIRATH